MKLAALFEDRYLPHARRTLKSRTVSEYGRLARKLILPKFETRDIGKLTRDEIERWHIRLSEHGKVQANRALAVLSALLTYAVDRDLLALNPCRGLHRNRETARDFFFTPAQSSAILAAASAWTDIRGRYLALTLLTGARPGELLDSCPRWRHGAALRTPDGKTGGRTIYLSPAAEAILDGLPAGPRYFPKGMDVRRAWVRVLREAGVPHARQYDMRHTFASASLAAGVGLDVIGRMLGHRKAATTLRYAHLAPDVGVKAAALAAARMGAV